MAHQITSTDQILSVREMPWHGLGVVLPDYPSREEAQQLVHPWEPITEPVYRGVPVVTEAGPQLEYEPVEGRKLVARSDNGEVLGDVNESLGIITNAEMWDVAEAVGGTEAGIQIETAGSLEGGRKVWALLRLHEPIEVKGDPHGETLAMFSLQNAHDGSGSFRGQAHNVRIVCANTSAAADASSKRTGHEFTFRHSSKVAERIEEAKAAVTLWREGVAEWQAVMEHLVMTRVDAEQREEFVARFQPMPPSGLATERVQRNVEAARDQLRSILSGAGGTLEESVAGTAYGLFQGAIEWQQHVRRTRVADGRARMEVHFKRHFTSDSNLRRDTLALVKEVSHA